MFIVTSVTTVNIITSITIITVLRIVRTILVITFTILIHLILSLHYPRKKQGSFSHKYKESIHK